MALTDLLSAPTDRIASITYFRPDKKKDGGAYVTVTGSIAKYDEILREIALADGYKIALNDIVEITVIQ